MVYQEQKISDLNQKKLIVLIPFQILKIKGLLEQKKDAPLSQNDIAYLQQLLQNDILGSIKVNLQGGNITGEDASQLRELTLQLYSHILAHNENLRRCTDMKPLLPGAMELPLDKFRIEIDELKEALAKSDEAKQQIEAEKQKVEVEKQQLESELAALRKQLKETQEQK